MDSLVFTTDFGLTDPYAGVIKGVALSINPDLQLIDLTHRVAPQDVAQASFILGVSFRYFPANAIHVVVVDPGVGTSRRPIVVFTPEGRFVAPDNGVLSSIIAPYMDSPPAQPGTARLPTGISAINLTNRKYWLHPVSNTFHGRDIFTPVAAHLSMGVPSHELGEPLHSVTWLPMTAPVQDDAGHTEGQVVYADSFGNLVTNISLDILPKQGTLRVSIKGAVIDGLSSSFLEPESAFQSPLVALAGSLGYLEIAVPGGSAARTLNAGPREAVSVVRLLPS